MKNIIHCFCLILALSISGRTVAAVAAQHAQAKYPSLELLSTGSWLMSQNGYLAESLSPAMCAWLAAKYRAQQGFPRERFFVPGWAHACSFTHDGSHLVVMQSEDDGDRLVVYSTGAQGAPSPVQRILGFNHTAWYIRRHPSGQHFLTAGHGTDAQLRLWQMQGQQLNPIPTVLLAGPIVNPMFESFSVEKVAYNRDGSRLAALVDEDRSTYAVYLYDIPSVAEARLTQVLRLVPPQGRSYHMGEGTVTPSPSEADKELVEDLLTGERYTDNPDGSQRVGGDFRTIVLHNRYQDRQYDRTAVRLVGCKPPRGESFFNPTHGYYGMRAIAYSPNGSQLACASDNGIRVWDIGDISPLKAALRTIDMRQYIMLLQIFNDAQPGVRTPVYKDSPAYPLLLGLPDTLKSTVRHEVDIVGKGRLPRIMHAIKQNVRAHWKKAVLAATCLGAAVLLFTYAQRWRAPA